MKKLFIFFMGFVSIFALASAGLAHHAISPVYLSDSDCTELTQPNTLIYIYPLGSCDNHCQQSFSLYKAIARQSQYQLQWKFFVKEALPMASMLLAAYSSGNDWIMCGTLVAPSAIWVNDAAGSQVTFTDAEELSNFLRQHPKKSGG